MFPTFGLDKVVAQIIGIGILLVLLVGGYYWWKHSIKTEALLEWNKAQQEQVAKEQQELIKDLTVINNNQIKIIGELDAQKKVLEQRFKDLEDYLDSEPVKKEYKGKSSSEVLKRTFKELNK